jgi:hypothetical protein
LRLRVPARVPLPAPGAPRNMSFMSPPRPVRPPAMRGEIDASRSGSNSPGNRTRRRGPVPRERSARSSCSERSSWRRCRCSTPPQSPMGLRCTCRRFCSVCSASGGHLTGGRRRASTGVRRIHPVPHGPASAVRRPHTRCPARPPGAPSRLLALALVKESSYPESGQNRREPRGTARWSLCGRLRGECLTVFRSRENCRMGGALWGSGTAWMSW